MQLIYNIALVSGIQQNDCYTHTHTYIYIYTHTHMYFRILSLIGYYKILSITLYAIQ